MKNLWRFPSFPAACLLLASLAALLPCRLAQAQGNGFFNQAVGGISISADGVVSQPFAKDFMLVRKAYLERIKAQPEELKSATAMRMISLRAIEEAVAKSGADNTWNLPEEIQYLAGIQRIEFVFVYPEQNDIVLAGPGEGWKVDESGNMVGITTGRPVLRLEDLIVALRTVENARQGGISVSIDPTEEGRLALDRAIASFKRYSPEVLDVIEKALGPQTISITGIPKTSRLARTLVASDYKMKRIAMKLDPSPVKGLGSYVDMLRSPPKNMMPRWWMACDYEPLAKSTDGLAWQLRGKGVKVLTEDEIITNGKVTGSGKTSGAAQSWADKMTSKYDELSISEPVFGELRNVMDLCVISALIAKEDLLGKANLQLPTLTGTESKLGLEPWWNAPSTVSTQCSVTHKGREFIITASGGVEINSWAIADKTVVSDTVAASREKAASKGSASLYW